MIRTDILYYDSPGMLGNLYNHLENMEEPYDVIQYKNDMLHDIWMFLIIIVLSEWPVLCPLLTISGHGWVCAVYLPSRDDG